MSGLVLRTLRGKKTKAGASKPFSIPVDESLGLKQGDLVRVRIKGLDKGAVADITTTVLKPAPKTTVPRIEIPVNVGLKDGEVVAIRFSLIDTDALEKWFDDDTSKPYKGGKA